MDPMTKSLLPFQAFTFSPPTFTSSPGCDLLLKLYRLLCQNRPGCGLAKKFRFDRIRVHNTFFGQEDTWNWMTELSESRTVRS